MVNLAHSAGDVIVGPIVYDLSARIGSLTMISAPEDIHGRFPQVSESFADAPAELSNVTLLAELRLAAADT